MIKIDHKEQCCGCEACVQACPKGCISFDADEEGFRYPRVDVETCIECGLCERVCPVLHQGEPREPLSCYGGWNEDDEVRLASSSGGIFSALAQQTLEQGGVVFGAAFRPDWSVAHMAVETKEDLSQLRGSKYVQSRIGTTYREAEEHLKAGRKVLYSGTGCQIAGLKHYLRKDYDNLLTVEVICHGVPSPLVWEEYVRDIENQLKLEIEGENAPAAIKDISFRDKKFGWHKYGVRISAQQPLTESANQKVIPHFKDAYMNCFLRNYTLRPSCYNCAIRCGKSGADLCLGDFWSSEPIPHIENDEKGLSAVLAYTEKGVTALRDNIGCKLIPVEYSFILNGNPVLQKSVAIPMLKDKFWKSFLATNSKPEVIKSFGKQSKKPTVISRIKSKVARTIYAILRKE